MGGRQSFPIVSLPRDRIVIVTGGNTGIGYQTAKCIAMMGATVIIACRSEQKAIQAIQDMNQEFEDEKQKETPGLAHYDKLSVEFMKLDCASLKSVHEFIEEFKASGRQLHVLLCNAGINTVKKTLTEDGNELLFQVNYLSHFLIAVSLLPVMRLSGRNCRIVFLSSLWGIPAVYLSRYQKAQTYFTDDVNIIIAWGWSVVSKEEIRRHNNDDVNNRSMAFIAYMNAI